MRCPSLLIICWDCGNFGHDRGVSFPTCINLLSYDRIIETQINFIHILFSRPVEIRERSFIASIVTVALIERHDVPLFGGSMFMLLIQKRVILLELHTATVVLERVILVMYVLSEILFFYDYKNN